MHRRDFFDPRRLAQSAGFLLGAQAELQAISESVTGQDITLVRYARPAMGTVFEIVLPFGHAVPMDDIYRALDQIDELEAQLTIYRAESEVSALNRLAALQPVKVSDELFDLLKFSSGLSEATAGAFDVTAGALVEAWGFVRGPRRVPSEDARQQAVASSGWKQIQLDHVELTVQYRTPGLQINLGSVGKGYALDRVAAFFREQHPAQAVLLHGGKSSVLGIGQPPGQPGGWTVSLEHPWIPDHRLATITLNDQAMATSAATFKHLVHDGKKLGHILDPRTGWPATGIASATAIADTAAQADALSTAFYVMGLDSAQEYCLHRPQVQAILLPDRTEQLVWLNSGSTSCE